MTIAKRLLTSPHWLFLFITLGLTVLWWSTVNLKTVGTKLGLLAGVIFTLGVILIELLPKSKHRWFAAGILLALITPLALGGFWFSPGQWGISDWDYYFSLHTSYRQTILQYHQFPLWNPYTCGGTAGLADPEFSVLTPTFFLELIFGVPTGLRLAIYLSTIVGGLGMLALAKRLHRSVFGSLLAAIAYMFGTVNLLEVAEGHVNIFAAMWIPWIFWAWLNAYGVKSKLQKPNSKRFKIWILNFVWPLDFGLWDLVCGIFLALTFLQGGIYLLSYTAVAFLLLILLARRHRDAFFVDLKAGLLALGLSAFKLIPVLFWLKQFPDKAYASSTYTLLHLHQILLGRYLHGTEVIPGQGGGWHEYGAYIGIFVLALALFESTRLRRNAIVRGLIIAALIATLLSSTGPLLKPFFDVMPFIPRSDISRTILFAIVPICLLAAYGLDRLRQDIHPAGSIMTTIVIGLVALDLMSLVYPLSLQAFVLPPVIPPPPPAKPPLEFIAFTYPYRVGDKKGQGVDYTRSYAATLAGYGTLNYCSSLGPDPRVRTIHDEGDHSIVGVFASQGVISHVDWSPNRVHVQGVANTDTKVMLNTNYAEGWTANGEPTKEVEGRVSKFISPGPFDLTFRYWPTGFTWGLVVTVLTILILAAGVIMSL